jgi:hypothetical protein
METISLWACWQALLTPFRRAFTAAGWRRFAEWVTGLALNPEEHTVTQSLIALDRPQDWKALESFVELGTWDQLQVEQCLAELTDTGPGSRWHGYRVWAFDDTKVHRSSPDVWGVCTFHEYTARCPNRAATVRAHNWVVLGRLLEGPGQPAAFLPQAARLYCRRCQLPQVPVPPPFRTKCQLAVELCRQRAHAFPGRNLAVFDGGFAFASVVRPLRVPEPGQPPIDFLTRLRQDARLYRLPPAPPPGRPGRPRRWGAPLPPPRQGGHWPGGWQQGAAFVYGRRRAVRWKEVVCLWRVLGAEVPVKAVVAEVEGYRRRFTLVSSATGLTGLQLVELFAARFRQEDGFRDLKQRLGWEEGRAWTRLPLERTTQALLVTQSLLRLLPSRLEQAGAAGWWAPPPWDRGKDRPSIRDAQRLLQHRREEIRHGVAGWWAEAEKEAG